MNENKVTHAHEKSPTVVLSGERKKNSEHVQ